MAEAMLIGAGLGAGGAMLSGQDPLKGAAIGGAMGGASAGFGGAAAGAGTASGMQGASHLAQTGAQQAAANASMGGLGSTIGSGFTDLTGMTGKDVAQMGVQEGLSQVATPTPEQQIQHTPMGTGIIQPNIDLAQGTPTLTSNPRLKKLKLQQGLL
jgi:hypothetical protein